MALGDKKEYDNKRSAPLKYHNFMRWVCFPLDILGLLASLVICTSSIFLFADWQIIIRLIAVVLELAFVLVVYIGVLKWKPYAWYGLLIYLCFTPISSLLLNDDNIQTCIINFLLQAAVSALEIIYYYKRRYLFLPKPPVPQQAQPEFSAQPFSMQQPVYTNIHIELQPKQPDDPAVQTAPQPQQPVLNQQPADKEENSQPKAYCTNCGAKVLQQSKFCINCGEKL